MPRIFGFDCDLHSIQYHNTNKVENALKPTANPSHWRPNQATAIIGGPTANTIISVRRRKRNMLNYRQVSVGQA